MSSIWFSKIDVFENEHVIAIMPQTDDTQFNIRFVRLELMSNNRTASIIQKVQNKATMTSIWDMDGTGEYTLSDAYRSESDSEKIIDLDSHELPEISKIYHKAVNKFISDVKRLIASQASADVYEVYMKSEDKSEEIRKSNSFS